MADSSTRGWDTRFKRGFRATAQCCSPGTRQLLIEDALDDVRQQGGCGRVKFLRRTGLGFDFYDPPIPLTVQGSLFFDVTHAMGSKKPGPSSAKPRTIWDLHPITSIRTRTV